MYKKLKMKMKNFEFLKIFHFFQNDIKCSIDIQRHEKKIWPVRFISN